MTDAAAGLFTCAREMGQEADRLERCATLLEVPIADGAAFRAAGEDRRQLQELLRDLAERRREAAVQLDRAAMLAESFPALGTAVPSPFDDRAVRLDAIAHELESIALPQALRVERDRRLQLLELGLMVGSPALGSLLWWRAAQDVSGPDPQVRPLVGSTGSSAEAALDESRPESVSDLVEACGLVDAIGQKDSAVIDVARVTHADGTEAWIVTLPSTQDWVLADGDAPAPNDLDAILAQSLLAGQESTYSRGIQEAIRQADIPAGAPVLLVGFSLGGITAADLARTGLGKVSVEGVVVAGAPIDMADDPPGIPVLSLVHEEDLVPALDLAPEGDGPLRTTVTDTTPEGMSPHSAAAYAVTAAAHDESGLLSTRYQQFLATDAADRIDHRQIQIVER